jgi:hypothetical protein
MYKMLACLVAFLLMTTVLLGLRRTRLSLTSQSAHLFEQIIQRRHIIWDLQTRIAASTNPIVLAKELKKEKKSQPAPLGPPNTDRAKIASQASTSGLPSVVPASARWGDAAGQ